MDLTICPSSTLRYWTRPKDVATQMRLLPFIEAEMNSDEEGGRWDAMGWMLFMSRIFMSWLETTINRQ